MKPYNDAEARAGAPVVTRDGNKVRIICFDAKSDWPIVALILYENDKEIAASSDLDGRNAFQNAHADLFMAPTKRAGWVNVYSDSSGGPYVGNIIYKTKDDADKFNVCRIACTQIEWEE